MPRIILHIDFDSFFASVEQQHNPLLRNKPMGVTAANGRTCIIASSREAKKLGIKTGARTYEAKRTYPTITFVKADFVKYFEVSKKFLKICSDYSPYVELFSIDEVFIDLTSTAHLFDGTYNTVIKIKERIKKEIGEYITASVGISYNKLLAKLASGLKKPDGIMEIKPSDVPKVYASVKLTDICGIGERVKTRLNKIGVHNLIQLRRTSFSSLVQEFGKAEAVFLKNVSLSIDNSSVIPCTSPQTIKSISRNYCLPKNEYDQRIILQNIYELCEEIGIKLRKLNKKARTVGLSLRGGKSEHGRKTVTYYIDSGKEIFSICQSLYKQWKWADNPIENKRMVRMISIWVENLEDSDNLTISLFDEEHKKDHLSKTIDAINNRFGNHTIRNGFLLYANKLTTVPNGYLADKYERTKLADDLNE